MNRLENIRRAAHMRRVCAAGGMRCPDGRRLFRLRENPLLRARGADFVETPGGFALIGALTVFSLPFARRMRRPRGRCSP